MKLAIGNDHTAVEMKNEIMAHLEAKGIEVVNVGVDTLESCHYPVSGYKVAKMVAAGEVDGALSPIPPAFPSSTTTATSLPSARASSASRPPRISWTHGSVPSSRAAAIRSAWTCWARSRRPRRSRLPRNKCGLTAVWSYKPCRGTLSRHPCFCVKHSFAGANPGQAPDHAVHVWESGPRKVNPLRRKDGKTCQKCPFMHQTYGTGVFVLWQSYTNESKFVFAQDSLQKLSFVYDSKSTARDFYAFLREQGPRREAGAAGMRAERRCWAASGLRKGKGDAPSP